MPTDRPRITGPVLKVLGAFFGPERVELSGAEIARSTKLQSGTLYPILVRLERAQWLESHWEEGDPKELGRPRRRFYRITAIGATAAREEFHEIAPAFRRVAWA
jgi:PadR family transcriptional regulator, regulatory protein PadR